jgi:NAD(P)-dependent dehydrogenase (short-subunit alcohol dehydrogenase family)
VLKTELRKTTGGDDMTDLKGKTALVTGSVQGIGLAIAEALAGAGARIAVNGLAGDAQIHEVCHRLKECRRAGSGILRRRPARTGQIERMMEAVAAWGGATSWSTMPASSIPRRLAKCRARNGMRSSRSTCRRRSTPCMRRCR